MKVPVENITIQWSISSEALDPNNHAFGGTWGGDGCSFHHNLFACNTGRNPSIGFGGTFDFRNNVLFNWRHRTIDGGDGSSQINLVANYFKPGPATTSRALRHRICKVSARPPWDEYAGFGKWYVADNYVHGYPEISEDNWAGGVYYAPEEMDKGATIPMGMEPDVRAEMPFSAPQISEHTAKTAYQLVLAHAGASLPVRDAVDQRVIESVRTGKPSFGDGILNTPDDVSGYPEYRSVSAPPDGDRDGMPDEWEARYNLNKHSPLDAAGDHDKDGYTNLEEYLNGTDPTQFVDYTEPKNNRNVFHRTIGREKQTSGARE
jgi:hypothetical protein